MLLKLYMLTSCSPELISAYPFILKSKHDTVSTASQHEEKSRRELAFFTVSFSPGAKTPNEVRSELY